MPKSPFGQSMRQNGPDGIAIFRAKPLTIEKSFRFLAICWEHRLFYASAWQFSFRRQRAAETVMARRRVADILGA